jgi:uncharacterized membrane protein required for colicin V production
MKHIVDLVLLGFILLITYVITSEGLWGSALMFFNVVFAAMIAFNFYEPLAALLDWTGIGWGFSDTLCMLGLFCVSLLLLRIVTESIAPAMVRFPIPLYHAGRLIFGLATSLVTIAIILLAFHAAPVHKKIFGVVDYQTKPPFGLGLDHQWLGFFQYETGAVFARYGGGRRDPHSQYGHGRPLKLFDPRAEWLILHQEARPYGEGSILGSDTGDKGAGAGQAPTGPGGPGGAPAGGPI